MMVVIGANSLGRALLASGDVRATQDGLVAAGMLGVAAKRSPTQRGLVAGRHRLSAGGLAFVLKVEFVGFVFIVPWVSIGRHLGALKLHSAYECQDGGLDLLPAHRVDWMSAMSACSLARPSAFPRRAAVFVKSASALVAETTPQVALRPTIVVQRSVSLKRWHRHEETLWAPSVIFRSRMTNMSSNVILTKGLQPFVAARVVLP